MSYRQKNKVIGVCDYCHKSRLVNKLTKFCDECNYWSNKTIEKYLDGDPLWPLKAALAVMKNEQRKQD